jgi:dTDP-4-dehydrorhamnose 3,5-epimerase
MYIIENSCGNPVRAWQGHKIEKKWFFVIDGKFEIFLVKIDNWDNPGKDLDILSFELDSSREQVLYVPGGYANGIKSLTEGSRLLIYSDQDVMTSKKDDYRFDKDTWGNWEF